MNGSDWTPGELALLTTILRWRHGGTAEELSQRSGVSRQTIVAYQQGQKKEPRLRNLERLAVSSEVPPRRLGPLRQAVREVLAVLEAKDEAADDLQELVQAYVRGREVRVSSGLMAIAEALSPRRISAPVSWEEDRSAAPVLWARLERYGPAAWEDLVEDCEEFWSAALVELICEKSLHAASDDAHRPLELALIALKIAHLVPGDDRWRQAVIGYAWAHVGNALRIANRLSEAEEAFVEAKRRWAAGADSRRGLVNEARVLGLEASLMRDRRLLGAAVELLGRALELDRGDETKYLLISKAHLHHMLGEDDLALVALEEAAPLVDQDRELRLLFALQFDRVVLLCALDRTSEAEERLSEVRQMAERLGQALYSLRVRWLEGQVSSAAGRWEEAATAFEGVRKEFKALELPYERALVSSELAAVYLEQGRPAEAKTVASEMYEIFERQQVHPEAAKALQVFCEAARREELNAELARRVVRYLQRARYDPQLRFAA